MRVVWTTPARDDLRSINVWLRAEANGPVAVRLLQAIRTRAEILVDFPHSGRPYRDGLRILRVYDTPYILRYRIMPALVEILRVHHERENWFVEL